MGFARTMSKNPGNALTRLQIHAKNNLGVIYGGGGASVRTTRNDSLDILDAYYEGTQYDGLPNWDEANYQMGEFQKVRQRRPRINWRLGKIVVDKVASKIVGTSTFPKFVIEDDDDDTAFFGTVLKASHFKARMLAPIKQALAAGSVFVHYSLIDTQIVIEYTKSKYSYPTFDDSNQLDQVELKYVFEDTQDLDQNKEPKQKWYRKVLTKTSDILYDNPEYMPNAEPTFKKVSTVNHELGWVQGEWFCTDKEKHNYDGDSVYGDVLDFIDELCYSLSQSSAASSYGQDPQLIFQNMDEEDLDGLIKSAEKAWSVGRDGEAKFLETTGKGVEVATALRGDMIQRALDVIRICLHDPEKIGGNAQSGEALKQLYAPLIELVDDLRAAFEQSFCDLLLKISMTCLAYNALGEETAIEAPNGYLPGSVDFTVQWPPLFPATINDIFLMSQAAEKFSQANVISRESLTRWLASATPIIDNADEELKRIESQPPPPNPFGDPFGGSPQ